MRILSALTLALLVTNVFAYDLKIGYIDIEKVIINTPQYQQDINKINGQFQQTKSELLALFDHINLLKNSLALVDKDSQSEGQKKSLTT